MIKLYTLLALLLCSYTSQAQKIRFTDTTNEWTYVFKNPFNGPLPATVHIFRYTGDSIVNSISYQKLTENKTTIPTLLVREDTLAGKVYYRSLRDTAERILYDYNMAIGDTLGFSESCPIILDTVYTIYIGGYAHKLQLYGGQDVIEGIGILREIFNVVCTHPDMWGAVKCFKNKGNIVTVDNPWGHNFLSPATCLLSVDDAVMSPATLSPNPVDGTSTLRFKTPVTGMLMITNAIGQVVAQVQLQQQYEVRIGHRISAPGVYFYRFSGADGVATGSFVKE